MLDELIVNGKSFPTLLALTSKEQEIGLMYQEFPTPVMSFVYAKPYVNSFWMKNCPAPLDIVFTRQGKIISIMAGLPHSTAIIDCREPSDLVVEFPAGTCKANGINVGDNIQTQFSTASLKKIFLLKNGFGF